MSEIILEMKNITKTFPGVKALDNVNLRVKEGEIHALVGENGAGKSTLFKIISKELSYDDGEVFVDKNKTLGYLSQHLDLQSENSIYSEMVIEKYYVSLKRIG